MFKRKISFFIFLFLFLFSFQALATGESLQVHLNAMFVAAGTGDTTCVQSGTTCYLQPGDYLDVVSNLTYAGFYPWSTFTNGGHQFLPAMGPGKPSLGYFPSYYPFDCSVSNLPSDGYITNPNVYPCVVSYWPNDDKTTPKTSGDTTYRITAKADFVPNGNTNHDCFDIAMTSNYGSTSSAVPFQVCIKAALPSAQLSVSPTDFYFQKGGVTNGWGSINNTQSSNGSNMLITCKTSVIWLTIKDQSGISQCPDNVQSSAPYYVEVNSNADTLTWPGPNGNGQYDATISISAQAGGGTGSVTNPNQTVNVHYTIPQPTCNLSVSTDNVSWGNSVTVNQNQPYYAHGTSSPTGKSVEFWGTSPDNPTDHDFGLSDITDFTKSYSTALAGNYSIYFKAQDGSCQSNPVTVTVQAGQTCNLTFNDGTQGSRVIFLNQSETLKANSTPSGKTYYWYGTDSINGQTTNVGPVAGANPTNDSYTQVYNQIATYTRYFKLQDSPSSAATCTSNILTLTVAQTSTTGTPPVSGGQPYLACDNNNTCTQKTCPTGTTCAYSCSSPGSSCNQPSSSGTCNTKWACTPYSYTVCYAVNSNNVCTDPPPQFRTFSGTYCGYTDPCPVAPPPPPPARNSTLDGAAQTGIIHHQGSRDQQSWDETFYGPYQNPLVAPPPITARLRISLSWIPSYPTGWNNTWSTDPKKYGNGIQFSCYNDGNWSGVINTSSSTTYTYDGCTYPNKGNYTAAARVVYNVSDGYSAFGGFDGVFDGQGGSGVITTTTMNITNPVFSYSLSNGGDKSVGQGTTVSNTITATNAASFTQPVSFSVTGLPTGATGSFSPTSCNPTCSTVLNIFVGLFTPTGTYNITVTGSANGVADRTTTFKLTVSKNLKPCVTDPNIIGSDCSGSGGGGGNGQPTVVQPNYCTSGPAATVNWGYGSPNGSPQSAYQVQVATDPSFNSIVADSGQVSSSNKSWSTGAGVLQFGNKYYARVKVWDSHSPANSSDWDSSNSFNTPAHAYPQVNFSWSPTTPAPAQNIQFTDQTTFYDNNSNGHAWSWTFGDSGASTAQNPTHTYNNAGNYTVNLTATDRDGFSCSVNPPPGKTITVQSAIPTFKEVPPKP